MSRDDQGDGRAMMMEADNDLPMDVDPIGEGDNLPRVPEPLPPWGDYNARLENVENGPLPNPINDRQLRNRNENNFAGFPMFWAEPIRLAQPSYRDNDVMDHFEALEVRRMWRDQPVERAPGNDPWMDVYRPPVPLDPDRNAEQIFADAANGGVVPLEHLMNMGEIEIGEFHEFESDGESSGIGTDNEDEPDDEEQVLPAIINFPRAH